MGVLLWDPYPIRPLLYVYPSSPDRPPPIHVVGRQTPPGGASNVTAISRAILVRIGF